MKKLFFVFLLPSLCFAQNSGWFSLQTNTNEDLNDILFINTDTGFAVGNNGTIIKTTDGGSKWELYPSISFNNLLKIFIRDNSAWIIGNNGTLLKTTDLGINWTEINFPSNNINDLYFFNSSSGILLSDSIIYKTTDGGNNWIDLVHLSFFSLPSNFSFINAAIGFLGNRSKIYKTTDSGASWSLITSQGGRKIHFLSEEIGYKIGVNPIDGTNVCKTIDSGYNWTWYSLGSGDFYFLDENLGWNLRVKYIDRTSNGGDNWDSYLISNSDFFKKIYFVNEDIGYAAGSNGVIYKTLNGGITDIKTSNNLLSEFSLSQNYPNPFNPTTKIKYTLPISGLAAIKVYDILGNEIATLVNEMREPGEYEVEFNGSSISSGVYFYRISVGSYSEIKKMILLQ